MRIRTKRNPATRFPCQEEQIWAQILTVRISIYLHRFIEFGRTFKNTRPIRSKPGPVVIDPAAWMSKDLNGRIAQGGEVAFRLLLLAPQSRMKTADDDVQLRQGMGLHVA